MILGGGDQQVERLQQVPDRLLVEQVEREFGFALVELERLIDPVAFLLAGDPDRLEPCSGLLVGGP